MQKLHGDSSESNTSQIKAFYWTNSNSCDLLHRRMGVGWSLLHRLYPTPMCVFAYREVDVGDESN